MKVSIKGQVTIPKKVREDLDIRPGETEVEFVPDNNGNWYLRKIKLKGQSRFRQAHKVVNPIMSTKELIVITRN